VTPRVTVLIAVYNGGAYLREAVESVLAQTFEDFELLIVDDSSTDDAVATLPKDPRIRILRNERNLGQIPSLNRGLREAQGELVARLDHDDVCLPRRLELQVDLLDRHPEVVLAATWVDIVNTQGRFWTHVRPSIESFGDFVCHIVSGHVHLVHPSLTFRRDVVLGLGGFDESLNASEDQDLYRRLVLARRDARVVTETLVRYRRHEQQMTVAKSASVWESDTRSYNAFIRALSPASPSKTIRLMLRNDRRFWEATPLSDAELEWFLDASAATLALDDGERAALARTLAHGAAATLLSGWAGDSPPSAYGPRAVGLAHFVERHGNGGRRALASSLPLLTATVRVGRHFGTVRARVGDVLRSDKLTRARNVARDSRALRRVYARIVDTRPET
jgi:glycosyltransferase involved in cell wall biosynthesis